MSFFERFESKEEGINDTIEFTIRMAITTLSLVIVVVVLALVVGLFMPNEIVDSTAVLEMINPAFQTIVGAFVGLLGGLSLNANARDSKETPNDPPAPIDNPSAPAPDSPEPSPTLDLSEPIAHAPAPAAVAVAVEAVEEPAAEYVPFDENGDGELQPWEIHRHDLRYDANGDGVVDENDFPNWRANIGGGQ